MDISMGLPQYGALICRLEIPFPPTENGMFFNRKNPKKGQKGRGRTDKYNKWLSLASGMCLIQKTPQETITRDIMAVIRLHRPDKRIRDCANYEKAPIDMLVKLCVLEDDHIIVDNRQLWIEGDKTYIDLYEYGGTKNVE